ncbi:hypothetical protein B0H16DRAFT_1898169 [Mycena metata]|uniref:Uncharacterized protein n=1 Tax=Mycena metata TaxID=1033252 RepID=A0AAD7HBG7_9AGAR|nr:hypothetical protein B0H16DRAFT_1898169 [Mycena metata]
MVKPASYRPSSRRDVADLKSDPGTAPLVPDHHPPRSTRPHCRQSTAADTAADTAALGLLSSRPSAQNAPDSSSQQARKSRRILCNLYNSDIIPTSAAQCFVRDVNLYQDSGLVLRYDCTGHWGSTSLPDSDAARYSRLKATPLAYDTSSTPLSKPLSQSLMPKTNDVASKSDWERDRGVSLSYAGSHIAKDGVNLQEGNHYVFFSLALNLVDILLSSSTCLNPSSIIARQVFVIPASPADIRQSFPAAYVAMPARYGPLRRPRSTTRALAMSILALRTSRNTPASDLTVLFVASLCLADKYSLVFQTQIASGCFDPSHYYIVSFKVSHCIKVACIVITVASVSQRCHLVLLLHTVLRLCSVSRRNYCSSR